MASSSSQANRKNQDKKNKVSPLAAITAVYEAERQKLADEVHDGIGQSLTVLRFMMEQLSNTYKDDQTVAEARILTREIQVEVRKLCANLQPASQDTDSRIKGRKETK